MDTENRGVCPTKHPIVNVDGIIAGGTQFDLDIVIPKDERDVIFGVIKDCYKNPVGNAVVKLIEIDCESGKKVRKPVTHTFTDECGEFVFGPLCPDRRYEILVFANEVKHLKVCAKCNRDMDCLKAKSINCCDVNIECSNQTKCNDKCENVSEDKCERTFEKEEKECNKICNTKCAR